MNISNLKEGMIVKNYKELCALLDEKPKGGKGKVYQLKEFERYFSYEKEGHKFVITSIYEIPLPKEDKRIEGNNSIYSENIQKLILFYLSQQDNEMVLLSCSKLLLELDIINKNYRNGRNNVDELSKIVNIEKRFIYDFYNNTQSSLKSKLETALNKLNRKSLITWKKVIMVAKENVTIVLNEAGTPLIQDDQIVYNKTNEFDRATEKEEKDIIRIEREVMELMGFYDKKDIFINGKYNEFRKKVENKLRKKYSIQFYYSAYEILFNKEHIQRLAVKEIDSIMIKLILNGDIIDSIIDSCSNRHIKALDKYKLADPKHTENEYCKTIMNDKYISNNKELANKLIKMGAKDLKINKR